MTYVSCELKLQPTNSFEGTSSSRSSSITSGIGETACSNSLDSFLRVVFRFSFFVLVLVDLCVYRGATLQLK